MKFVESGDKPILSSLSKLFVIRDRGERSHAVMYYTTIDVKNLFSWKMDTLLYNTENGRSETVFEKVRQDYDKIFEKKSTFCEAMVSWKRMLKHISGKTNRIHEAWFICFTQYSLFYVLRTCDSWHI